MRRCGMLVLALVLCAAAPAAAQEPSSDSLPAAVSGVEAAPTQPVVGQPPVGSGLPRRAAPPRTMEAQWPIFALFAATWVAIIGYLLLSGRKVSRLADRLAQREVGR